MKNLLSLSFLIVVFVCANVQAEESDLLKQLCECDKTPDYRSELLKQACENYCRNQSKAPVGNTGVINWPKLPPPPKTNPFKYEVPDYGFYDLEMYRIGNEIYRKKLEDSRVLLERNRKGKKILKKQYLKQLDIYKKGILDYKDRIQTYKEFNLDIQRMRMGK